MPIENTRKKFGEVLTPTWLIDKMLRQAGDLTGLKVADLGANRGQFLARALKMYPAIDPRDWVLVEVQERYRRYHRRFTGWRVVDKLEEQVDIVLGNPPYNRGLDLKLLLACKHLTRRILVVHPSAWLVDVKTQLGPKTGSPLFRKFQDAVRDHVTQVEIFNGNPVFGIGLFVPCVVTDVDFSSKRLGAIKVKDVGAEDYREVFNIDDITLHGKDWDPTVKEFMGRVQKLCSKNGSVESHKGSDASSQFPIQLASVIGNWTASSSLKMVKDDFYTFLQKDPEGNRGVRSLSAGQIISCATEAASDNLLGYLQTDFARMCLALLKLSQNSHRGEHTLVPWLDFSRSWNDDQLFTMLGYPRGHAIREYAKRFLPDYHNIYREVFNIDDITLHGKDWDPTVKEFMWRVQKLCSKNGSLWGAQMLKDFGTSDGKPIPGKFYVQLASIRGNVSANTMGREQKLCSKNGSLWGSQMIKNFGTSNGKPDPKKFYVQLASIRGHVSANTMVQEDFYTMVMSNPQGNKGIRQPDLEKPGNHPTPTYVLTTSSAQDNLLGYLQTDFARLCLALYKTGSDLATGALDLVPWLDLSRSWNDDQLFTLLGYPRGHAIREYAKRFLPDYHNIYPNGKTY